MSIRWTRHKRWSEALVWEFRLEVSEALEGWYAYVVFNDHRRRLGWFNGRGGGEERCEQWVRDAHAALDETLKPPPSSAP